MSEENKKKVKPKYNDADTKKEGSLIETPFKHSDSRNKLRDIANLKGEPVVKLTESGELKIEKSK